jgi:hypothetical protein
MDWNEIVDRVTPSIVKIETPRGHGTGFLCFYNEPRTFCFIATALHVVEHAERWLEPMRIQHFPSGGTTLLQESERVIFTDEAKDSAVILMPIGKLDLPEQPITLRPTDNRLPIGVEVGWLGYPAIQRDTLCFFSGSVSAWQEFRNAYLIDGVAINGISGGPVLYGTTVDGIQIVGAISAYMPNRLTSGTLPGLSIAQDVSHFHDIITRVRSIDEANRTKQVLTEQQSQVPAPEIPAEKASVPVNPTPQSDTEE